MTAMFCGTGIGNFPKPGDPDNSSGIRAIPAFGGVDVTWDFPILNPHAVAHLQLYRGYTANPDQATRHVIVSGNFYYDKTESSTPVELYYWIQVVSVNGTVGEMIGPASATARPTAEDMIRYLSGKINAGVLAESLRTDIGEIGNVKLALNNERILRVTSLNALGETIDGIGGHGIETRQIVMNEIQSRATADQSILHAVNGLNVAIADETNARVAAVQSERLAWTTETETLGQTVDIVAASIITESSERTAAIQAETLARTTAYETLAQQINTAQSVLGSNIASVQTSLQTNISNIGDKVTQIGAQYTAKVSANGLIGGFGVYNDGREVQAGFDVDTFWVGKDGTKIKPFIVSGAEVFINQAVINQLTFSKLRDESGGLIVENGKIRAQFISVGDIQSLDYIPGVRGWRLLQNGEFEINGSLPGTGSSRLTNLGLQVRDSNGTLRLRAGLWPV